MNLLDWILLVLIGLSTLYGLFKGLVKEVISLLAVIIGLVGASRFYEGAFPLLKNLGVSEQVAKILSFVILFIIIFFALVLIGKLLHKFIQVLFLGWLNRLAGIGFGFIRGVIVSGILIILLTVTLSDKAPILTESKLTPHIVTISKVLLSLVPENLQRRFMEQEKKLREFWERKITTRGVDFWGWGLIQPNFVIGVEMAQPKGFKDVSSAVKSTAEGWDFLMSHGVLPRYNQWTIESGSAFSNQQRPPLEYFIEIQKAYAELRWKHKFDPPFPSTFSRSAYLLCCLQDFEYYHGTGILSKKKQDEMIKAVRKPGAEV